MTQKETAVEWLECELKKIPFINVIEVFERAKQMEREQKHLEWQRGKKSSIINKTRY